MNIIRKAAAHILLISIYGFTHLVSVLSRMIPRRPWKPTGRIIVTGTFHNPGWYLSHIIPLVRSGVKEVILVVDEPQIQLERVRFVCPPKWASRLFSRAGAKAIWTIIAGLRCHPDLYMGYHIAPGACSALLAGKLLGRPACYQMTAGPVEIIGGGIGATESVGARLGRPSKLIESLALGVVKQFDIVVVRGSKAKEYLMAEDINTSVAIITGSVNVGKQLPQNDRDIHLIFVGRLAPVKQVDQFITTVNRVKRIMPNVHAVIVGDGPLMAEMKEYASRLGVMNNIEFFGRRNDVEEVLSRSKIFLLTSRSEGLSISIAEAMVTGVVPVVADVGELRDLVIDDVNGYLVEPDNIDEYTKRVVSLLQDEALWEKHSRRAIQGATMHCGIPVVSEKWRHHFQTVISEASGLCL